MVHTIGDSHAGGVPNLNGAFDKIECIRKHWLGPKLMYTISREGLNLNALNVLENDTIILCFGEIDCRCHVHKHIVDSDYKQVIEELVKFYFDFILSLINDSKVKVCVYNVVPPVQKERVEENQSYPFLGTDEDRKFYVTYMNSKLREFCEFYNIIFIDVYDMHICENGFLKREMSDGNVHITDSTHIEKFLKNHKII